jgi:hypothetical protein
MHHHSLQQLANQSRRRQSARSQGRDLQNQRFDRPPVMFRIKYFVLAFDGITDVISSRQLRLLRRPTVERHQRRR